MKKTVILLIVIFSAVSAFGAVFQNKLLVELTDDSAQNVRLSGTLQGIIEPIQDETILLEPVFYLPSDPKHLAVWYDLGMNRWFRVVSDKRSAEQIVQTVKAGNAILSTLVETPSYALEVPNDYDNYDLWGLDRMNLPEAWDIYHADSQVIISTIDTGCRIDHPDLESQIYTNYGEDANGDGVIDESDENGIDDDNNGFIDDFHGWDFVNSGNFIDPEYRVNGEDYLGRDNEVYPDIHGHGTHVAGIAGAVTNNNVGVASAGWNLQNMPLRAGMAIVDNGYLNGVGYDDDFAAAVMYATDMGARVISISFGGGGVNNAYRAAFQYARTFGVIIFAAAGNDGSNQPSYPANYDEVLAVAATNPNDTKAGFSNYGDWVALSAPGVNIWSTMSNNQWHAVDYIAWDGTSMATPNAAAVAGLIISYNPGLDGEEVEDILLNSCDNIDNENPTYAGLLGAGRINAEAALQAAPPFEFVIPSGLEADLDTENGSVALAWDPVIADYFLHYAVYRNGQLIGEADSPEYADELPEYGTFEYSVSSVYEMGESDPSEPVVVTWEVEETTHFDPVIPTGNPYALIIEDARIDEEQLAPDMEIGIFDSDLCVGAEVVDGTWPLPITAWQGDVAQGLEGFMAGNPISYLIWDGTAEYDAAPDYSVGNGTFAYGPFSQLTLQAVSLQFYEPVLPTGSPYAIIVEMAMLDGDPLVQGSEIGVFDDDLCVGATIITGDWPIPLTAWESAPAYGLDGFTVGNPMSFTVWTDETEYSAAADYLGGNGNGTFGYGPFSQVNLQAFSFQFYQPVVPTGLPYALIVQTALLDGAELPLESEIGAFDGELCVGAGIVTGNWPVPFTAWQSDPAQGLEGYTPGHEIVFTVWDGEEEFSAEAEYEVGNGTFGFGPFSQFSLYASSLQYYEPVPPTGQPYAIIVTEATFEDASLLVGDEIGFFDGDVCVGAMAVNGEWPMPVVTWQSDAGQGLPGFIVGNPIIASVWLQETEEVFDAQITYQVGNGTYGFGPFSQITLAAYSTITMTLPLQGNYFELVSTYVVPDNLDAEAIFGGINDLAIVYQHDGGMYFPPVLNTIGDITVTYGYRIFCRSQSELTIEGHLMDPGTVYHLTPNSWNWFGYPFDHNVPSTVALAEIEPFIRIVQSDDGRMWVPPFVNTLGNLHPGEGYMTIVTEDVEFQYSEGLGTQSFENFDQPDEFMVDERINPTGLPYAVIIKLAGNLQGMNPAQVELYDGAKLVGSGFVDAPDQWIPAVAWQEAPEQGMDGFVSGHQIHVVLKNSIGEIIAEETDNTNRFGEGAYAQIELEQVTLPDHFSVSPAFPNPFNGEVSIPFQLPASGEVTISLTNVIGQQIYRVNGNYQAGNHTCHLNTTRPSEPLGSGVYFIRVDFRDQSRIQKIMLLK